MTIEKLLQNFRRNPDAALAAYTKKSITFVAAAGEIYEFPDSGGVKRLDTWYTFPQGRLMVQVNVAAIVAPSIDISWIEEGQQLQITLRILRMDYMALGGTLLSVEPA